MALTDFQKELLTVLSKNRDPNSHFAGGATLNRNHPRLSNDFDIFTDDPKILARSVTTDLQSLRAAGYTIDREFPVERQLQHFKCAVSRDGQSTEIDWSCDTVHRFFPAIRDADFGWRLSHTDLAVNKILALAGRREPRDYIDVVTLHKAGTTIATLANAAPGKDAGFTPELVLDEITRNARFSANDLKAVHSLEPIDPIATKRIFLEGVAQAREIFAELPLDLAGTIFVGADGRPVPTTIATSRSASIVKRPTSPYGALPQPASRPLDRGGDGK